MTKQITLYKLFGTANFKMKTFANEKSMKEFMQEKGLSRLEVQQIQLNSVDGAISFDINLLEETENGLEYVNRGDLYVCPRDEEKNILDFAWGVHEYAHLSKRFSTVNQCLKDFLKALKKDFYEGEEPEKTRYSIYDVYSTRELL
jgi:hypothetical protein